MLAGPSSTSTSFSAYTDSVAAVWAADGAAQLSDVSINADGTVHPIKDLQGLATLEWKGTKLDVYSYVGSEYAARTYSFDPVQNVFVGYRCANLQRLRLLHGNRTGNRHPDREPRRSLDLSPNAPLRPVT